MSAGFAVLALGLFPAATRAQTKAFNDTFTGGSTVNGAATAPNANAAAYQQVAAKSFSPNPPAITPGNLRFGIVSTSSGFNHAQALFTNYPVTLVNTGDYIELTVNLSSEGGIITPQTNSTLFFGLYNAHQVQPIPGGLNGTANTGVAGYAQNWEGYVNRIFYTGGNNAFFSRPAQPPAGANNQDVQFQFASATQVGSNAVSTLAAFATGSPYTEVYRITRASATTLTLKSSLYAGTTASGTPLYTQTVTSSSALTMVYDAFAIGWRATASLPSVMNVSAVKITTTGTTTIRPEILTQPLSQTKTAGDPVELTVVADGGNGTALSYQWKKNGSDVPGATSATYAIPSVALGDGGDYTVVVTDVAGSTTSAIATLTVSAGAVPPSIVVDPVGNTIAVGGSHTFSPTVNGTPPLSYQWQKSLDGGANFADIPGATDVSLGIAGATLADAGLYRVVVTNAQGSATSAAAALAVTQAPVITTQPIGAVLSLGAALNLSVTATGSPAPTYQWRKDGVAIAGATGASYSVPSVSGADTGGYTVVVTNSTGSVTSAVAPVAVLSATMSQTGVTPVTAATGLNPDTRLTITFNEAVTPGTAGVLRIHDAADDSVVDTIDLAAATVLRDTLRAASTLSTQLLPVQAKPIGGIPTNFNYYPVTVAGNTATIYPRNNVLTYGHTYYVKIEPGVFVNGNGEAFAGIADTTTWRFATKAAGPAAGTTSLTVAADGSGDFSTLQAALDFIPANNTTPTSIRLKNGTYFEEIGFQSKHFVTIIGEDVDGTVIAYPNNNTFNNVSGVYHRATLVAQSVHDFTLTNLTLRNTTPQNGSQAEAIVINGSGATSARNLVTHCKFFSYQDTVQFNKQTYVSDSLIHGDVDFMWGDGPTFFENCDIRILRTAGYFTQIRNGSGNHGFVFRNCRFTAPAGITGTFFGRIDPAGFPFSEVVIVDSTVGDGANNALLNPSSGANGANYLGGWWLLNNAASGTAAPNVHNWSNGLLDANAASLPNPNADTFTNMPVDATLQANYRDAAWVLNTNLAGSITGTWTPALVPVFTTQPASQSLVVGAPVSFSVTVSAVPAAAFQWQKDGADIAGATSATYAIASTTAADAGTYTVVATNSAGSATSAGAVLTLSGPPVITLDPVSQTVTAGANVTFTVAATGTGPITYQWQKDGSDIAGATNSSLTLTNVQATDAGSYTAVATTAGGSVTSAAAVLTVNPPAPAAPVATTASNVTATGFSANWNAAAGASSYRLDVATDVAFSNFVGGYQDLDVGNVLTRNVTGLSAGTAYYYRVRAFNGLTSANSATITVLTQSAAQDLVNDTFSDTDRIGGTDGSTSTSSTPSVSTPTATNTQWVANRVKQLVASATGMQWTFDSTSNVVAQGYFPSVTVGAAPVTLTLNFTTGNSGSSANNLRIALIDDTANGRRLTDGFSSTDATTVGDVGYALLSSGSNIGGGSTTNLALGTFKRVTTTSNGLLGTAGDWGSALASSAGATGYFQPNTAYTLQVVLTSTGSSLTIRTVVTGGNFAGLDYTATDAASPVLTFNSLALRFGTGSNQFSGIRFTGFRVTRGAEDSSVAPSITTQPTSQTVNSGAGVTFTAAASGNPAPTYQWQKDGVDLPGATSGTLSLTNVQAANAGSYRMVATNSAGTATSNAATLTVREPPVVTIPPASQSVLEGADVTFTVVATGTAPLSYQWSKDGSALAGGTSATLSLAAVTAANAGSYTVAVSNAAGSATSDPAVLTVNAVPSNLPPSIATQPSSVIAIAGGNASFTVVATGTAPLSYQWAKDSNAIAGATTATLSLAAVQAVDVGSYTVTVTNPFGQATSNPATLTLSATLPNSAYNLTGFATAGAGTTGGGVIPETDAAYRKVTTPQEFVQAVIDANKTAGAVKVIEIMNDLNLGWNEVGATVQGLASNALRSHAAPKLHPTLIATGVSVLDIKAKSGLTIFSANGATIKHVNFNVKGTSNIIIRNLRFDEMWEWDEASKGDYDSNDWDFITLSNGGAVTNVWIDHCTFTKGYDGVTDMKAGTQYVTMSWCRYLGDDGATNPNSPVRVQLAALEANKSAYSFYNFLRTNGFSVEDIVTIIQGHDKGHLMGSNSLDSENATLSATFHHQWLQNVWDRAVPRLRAGNVHNYNIYVDDVGVLAARRLRATRAALLSTSLQNTLNNTYSFNPPINGSISTEGGALLLEKSVYADCLWPLRNNQTDVNNPVYTGKILGLDSIYSFHNTDGTTTVVRGNSTDAGNPMGPFQAAIIPFSWNLPGNALPYAYTMDDPAQLPDILAIGAGAGKLTWAKENWLRTSYVDDAVAPSILTQPVSQTVAAGANVTFTVVASGSSNNYQWQKDGIDLAGATGVSLALTNVQAANAGAYTVIVSNTIGSVTSNPAMLTVTATAPVIVTPPAAQTANVGGSATFSVVVTGTAPFGYQWTKDGTDIPGATSATLGLTGITAADAGSYAVVVTNSAGATTSPAAVLTVVSPPAITTQPVSQSAGVGASVSFTVVATGTAPLGYQWARDGVAIAGATADTLTLNNVQAADAAGYTVTVSNAGGSITSATATLTVSTPPVILTPPASQSVVVGANVDFTVVASGSGNNYQWQKDGATLGGATSATLSLTNVQLADAGSYAVTVSNAFGSTLSTAATLTVNAPGAGDLYVAPNGVAGNPGTLASPTTLDAAILLVPQGGTIWVRGGTYTLATGVTVAIGNNGVAGATKNIMAYQNETPVLDFSGQAVSSSNRGLTLNGNYWVVRGLIVQKAGDNGIYIGGHHNIVQRCTTRFNADSGLQLGRASSSFTAIADWPSYNLILDCDSHDNKDPTNENADGFACKLTTGVGNVFRGCVAHNNIDDGWDLFTKTDTGPIGSVTIDQCIAYNNGVLTDGSSSGSGDKNGFKLGGEDIAVIHVVTRSLAFGNGKNGFTWNSNPGAIRLINNLAFDNAQGNFKFDQAGPVFFNNVSLWTTGNGVNDRYGGSSGIATGPSNVFWFASGNPKSKNDQGIQVSAASFLSLTVPAGGFARLADGSLALGAFGRPVDGSPLINAGTLPPANILAELSYDPTTYYEGAPDIGLVEVTAAGVAPAIVTPPASQSVTAGSPVTFNVAAAGSAPLSYQWLKNGDAIPGATSVSYTIAATTVADAGSYAVTVSNSLGSVTSTAAVLTVDASVIAPAITSQPVPVSVTAGGSASFTVVATGTAPLAYQWTRDGNAIAGATSATYAIAAATFADAGSYAVTVSNSAGSITSDAVALAVNAPAEANVLTELFNDGSRTNLSPPTSAAWFSSGGTVFTNGVGGNGTLALDNGSSRTLIGYATVAGAPVTMGAGDSLTLDISFSIDAAALNKSNGLIVGLLRSDANPAAVSGTGFTASGTPNSNGRVNADFASSNPSSHVFSNYVGYGAWTNLLGSGNHVTLRRRNVTPTEDGLDNASAAWTQIGASGGAGSAPATGTSFHAVLKLTRTLAGGMTINYQVTQNGSTLVNHTVTEATATTTTFDTINVYMASGTLTGTSAAHLTLRQVNLQLTPLAVAPSIATPPVAQSVLVGESANFTVAATGTAPLAYQWSKDGNPIAGATGATLSLSNVQLADAGNYTVTVSNTAGAASATAALTVTQPVAIVTPPTNQTVAVGSGVTFSVGATGYPAPTYQWRFNGADLPGATGASYSIASTITTSAGSYDVVVSNPAGSVTSTAATLTVTTTAVGTVVDDSFADGSASNENFATGSVRLFNGRSANTRVESVGSVAFSIVSTSSDAFWAHFTQAGSPVNLAVGDALKVEVTFSASGFVGTGQDVRFGVLNSAGTRNTTNLTGGMNSAVFNDDLGYGLRYVASTSSTPFSPFKRNPVGATANPGNPFNSMGATDWAPVTTAGSGTSTVASLTSGTPYTLTYSIRRDTDTNTTVTAAVTGGALPADYSYMATDTATTVTSFDYFGFRIANNSFATGLTFTRIKATVERMAPAITSGPVFSNGLDVATIAVGGSTTLSVAASGSGLGYQWYRNGTPLPGATSATLPLSNIQLADDGSYTVVVSNIAGSVTSSAAVLTVVGGSTSPTITMQPASITVAEGSGGSFSVAASGTAPFNYQWYHESSPIPGATSATYAIAVATPADAGGYHVVVSNSAGDATSDTATLIVEGIADIAPNGYAASVTGGAAGATVTVSTAADLKLYAENTTTPYTIIVSGVIDLGVNGRVKLQSHKTLRGATTSSTILGTINISNANDVIVSNLNVSANTGDPATNDGITIASSTNVLVTKCTIYDCTDGNLDVINGSDLVTVSWCKFYYTRNNGHNFSNLVGSSDTDVGAGDGLTNYRVTWHHNWWAEGVKQRNIACRFGSAHMFNNYWSNAGDDYCTESRNVASIFSEYNFYNGVNNPLAKRDALPTDVGLLMTIGNVFQACTGTQLVSTDTVFTPPYSYGLDNVTSVPARVMAGAGNVTVDAPVAPTAAITASSPVISGGAVTLTAVPAGFVPGSYQWRFKNVALPGATAATLNLTNIQPDQAGAYTVVLGTSGGDAVVSTPFHLALDPVTITLGNLVRNYDGTPRPASATTSPAPVTVALTYNGSATAPTYPGTYAVVAVAADGHNTTATGTLTIGTTVVVRHAPTIVGTVDGSLQVLSAENTTLSGVATITGDLLVPGTPTVSVTGSALLGGTLDGPGDVAPTTHAIALNTNALVRNVVRRINPVAMPVVAAPPAPTGTRAVAMNTAGQSAGDFTTLKNLTLSGSAGMVAVPPGTYGNFSAIGNSGFVFGVPGATEPAIYNLQNLSIGGLPGGAPKLQIVGPVILNLATGTILNGNAGNAGQPSWLTIRIANGGLTVSGSNVISGNVIAPNGTITMNNNATLNGTVVCDKLTVNGTSVLNDPQL
ncbi:MAG TPA: pectinesterase family protein [Lacunisphaera sp.]|nr:pectinesterase family protein [Lacunisphaera sp.]